MFRSIFAKYVTAFMSIIIFGFAILLLIVSSIGGNYSSQAKETLMTNTAEMIQIYLDEKMADCTPDDFSAVLTEIGENRLASLLESVSGFEADLSVLIADHTGKVCYVQAIEGDLPEGTLGELLPSAITKTLVVGGEVMGELRVESLGRAIFTCAMGIHNAEGELCGMIAVCSGDRNLGFTVENLTQTIVTSAALVLMASLIAAYFLTERTIAPLREMCKAARKFSAGKFETRVRVRGKDEVAELSEAFNQMADSLENLEKMRNSFVANVSHDLRTPMTTIAGFIDGIRDGVIPPEEHDHYLEIVSFEVQRLSRLVTSLLDISRIQAGDRKFTMKPFDICEMARLILISFEQNIEEKHLEVDFACEEDRMQVFADHDAIYQIFYNICHNAIKFSYHGGMLRLRILYTKEKKVLISVYNEGEGIPEADLPMVFDRFYKSDKSRGLDKSGVGLGLYIAKTIINAHEERIGVSSEAGKYCEFYFTLQRVQTKD